jgi:hypothetical protein
MKPKIVSSALVAALLIHSFAFAGLDSKNALAFAEDYKLPKGSTIFIEDMDQDLDGYIRAEFAKQKVALKIVGSPDEAQFVMVGSASEEERRKWHEGWLTTEKDKTSGTITVVDRKTKDFVWATEAGDRSFWWGSLARGGHRKVASRLVKHLKDALK